VLIRTPQNVVAAEGDNVYFNCSTNLTGSNGDHVEWRYSEERFVETDKKGHTLINNFCEETFDVQPMFQPRFELSGDIHTGLYQLQIRNVSRCDVGSYWCVDYCGRASAVNEGHYASANLSIINGIWIQYNIFFFQTFYNII